MHGPADRILFGQGFPELVVLTTDADSGGVTGAVSLGESWDHLLRDPPCSTPGAGPSPSPAPGVRR